LGEKARLLLTQPLGYTTNADCPASRRFVVKILLPPREHGPAHVHVFKAGGEVIIELGTPGESCVLREAHSMKTADIVRAVRIVEMNPEELRESWRKYHGG